jgi:iron complex transport system ATP-binding protein
VGYVEELRFSVGYRVEKPLIREVTLWLKPGSIYQIIGDNGTGKSSFYKTLLGLIPPLTGGLLLVFLTRKKLPL